MLLKDLTLQVLGYKQRSISKFCSLAAHAEHQGYYATHSQQL
jgi:hypothetical protein